MAHCGSVSMDSDMILCTDSAQRQGTDQRFQPRRPWHARRLAAGHGSLMEISLCCTCREQCTESQAPRPNRWHRTCPHSSLQICTLHFASALERKAQQQWVAGTPADYLQRLSIYQNRPDRIYQHVFQHISPGVFNHMLTSAAWEPPKPVPARYTSFVNCAPSAKTVRTTSWIKGHRPCSCKSAIDTSEATDTAVSSVIGE